MGFNYLFIYFSGYVALWDSKTCHRPSRESVSWHLETSLFLKTHFLGRISIPTSFVSLLYFFLPPFEDNRLSFWVSVSYASIQKLFCGICSAFKCSFNEFVGEKVVSPSYSSAILGVPPFHMCLLAYLFVPLYTNRCIQVVYIKQKRGREAQCCILPIWEGHVIYG